MYISESRNGLFLTSSCTYLVCCFFIIIGWVLKTKTSFSRNSAIFLLGKCYHFKADGNRNVKHTPTYRIVIKNDWYIPNAFHVRAGGDCCYVLITDEDSPTESSGTDIFDDDAVMGNVDGFRKDFASRIWLTYRDEFAMLPGSAITTDCGWGCTLRAGQMMLAQALLLHFLGRGQFQVSLCLLMIKGF